MGFLDCWRRAVGKERYSVACRAVPLLLIFYSEPNGRAFDGTELSADKLKM